MEQKIEKELDKTVKIGYNTPVMREHESKEHEFFCTNGGEARLRELILEGVDPNMVWKGDGSMNPNGEPINPLMLAARMYKCGECELDFLDFLVEHGADVNGVVSYTDDLLTSMLGENNVVEVNLLTDITRGRVNERTLDVMRWTLKHDIDVDFKYKAFESCCLFCVEGVEILVEAGVDPTYINKQGENALHILMAGLMFELTCDDNCYGDTPRLNVFKFLLDKGVDPNYLYDGRTVIQRLDEMDADYCHNIIAQFKEVLKERGLA